ncbi:hypothetical protein FACS1894199_04880 [Bacteroidia bacterium]|nr:hypothetical protein FACS1894199_04880 [Bacteroidia bacterium]
MGVAAANAQVVANGSCGTSATWELTGTSPNYTLTISGTGAMSDYSYTTCGYGCYRTTAPWGTYDAQMTSVIIESNVTTIGSNAFTGCTSLASVTIPSSVTTIGSSAFYVCTSLASITIPEGVTTIDYNAFQQCTSLASVTIPSSVTTIGDAAFYDCTSLASVTIPSSVTTIGDYAFQNCTSLASVTIPSGVTTIGEGVFYDCTSLASVTIPSSVTTIGQYAFGYCSSLASVTIPEGVTTIGSYAFYVCTSLASVTIPSSVTSIGSWAFYNCTSLASVTIPSSVTTIGGVAFSDCSSLTEINVDAANANYVSVDGVLFNNTKTTLIQYPAGKQDAAYTIPSGVTTIGGRAFRGCTSLASVTIPSSVTTIGERAFDNCTSLASVTIPSSVTHIGLQAFRDCTSLASVTIPEGVTTIGERAFDNCTSLASVTIPSSVTTIGTYVFYNCTSLASVTIGSGVTTIGSNAFQYCTSLISVTISEGVTTIGNYAFYGCTGLASVTIPSSVITINTNAFSDCSNLDTVRANWANPSSVTLGSNLFGNPPSPALNTRTLFIPAGTASLYESHSLWNLFKKPFIEYYDIANATVTISGDTIYTGSALSPAIEVTYGSTPLIENTNYTVSYSTETEAGDVVTVTLTGIGNYDGTKSKTFTIAKAAGTASVTLSGWTYGTVANSPVPVSTTNDISNVTYQYDSIGGSYNSPTQPVNAGTYRLVATFAATTNYEAVNDTTTFTIAAPLPSTDANLQGLTPIGTLSPAFDPDITDYTLTLPCAGNDSIVNDFAIAPAGGDVKYLVNDREQTMPIVVRIGITPLVVRSIAADGTMKGYNIRVIRPFPKSIIVQYWDDILAIDQSGGHQFKEYKWTGGGRTITTEKYYLSLYHENLPTVGATYNVEVTMDNGQTIEVCGGKQVEAMAVITTLTAYPNPVSSTVTVRNPDYESVRIIELFDLNGQLVGQYPSTLTSHIDVSALSSGVYVLRAGRQTQKIIIE